MNIVVIVLGTIIIYGMRSAVFVFGDPFPDVRVLIPARGLTSPEPSESVSKSVDSLHYRPSHRRENGPWSGSVSTGLIILTKFDIHPCQVRLEWMWRGRFRHSLLSFSMSTVLRCSDVGIGRVGRFLRSAKVQKLPCTSSIFTMLDVSVVFLSLLVSHFALCFYSWLGVMLCLFVATLVLPYCRCDWFH